MSINPKIFRAYDIRGRVEDFAPPNIMAIAHALASEYQHRQQTQLVLGHDARLDSPFFAHIFYQILVSYGLNVSFIGQCSSPMLYFSAQQHDGNGIMITASHNPKQDNGIKWLMQNLPPSPEDIQHIGYLAHNYFNQHDLHQHTTIPTSNSNLDNHFESYYQQYQDYILKDIHLHQPYKVVIDGLHGSAGHIAVRVLQALNIDVIPLRCHADGSFPDHAPDPSVEQHLTLIKQRVIAEQADLGIALDGDGDRLVLIDEYGQSIDADRTLCLFAELCLTSQPQREFVYDVKCSNMLKQCISKHHGIPKMIRTGSSFLRNYLQQQPNAIFAGEYSGHYAFYDGRGLGYDDAIYAGLRLIEYLQQTGQRLSEALRNYPPRHACSDLYIPLNHYSSSEVIQHFKQHVGECMQHHYDSDYELSEIDGIRFDFPEGFVLLRASNTGDYFTLRFDGDSAQSFAHTQQILIETFITDYPHIADYLSNISCLESEK